MAHPYTEAQPRTEPEGGHAEKASRSREAHLRYILDTIPDIVWTALPDGTQDYANRRWYEFNGIEPGKGGAEPWRTIIHPEDVQKTADCWHHALTTGDPYTCLHRNRRFDGEYRWMLTRAFPERDADGTIVRWIGTGTDITDLRRASEALRDGERRLRTFVEVMPQLVWSTDGEGRVDYVNPRWQSYTGQTPEEALGAGWVRALHPGDQARVADAWDAARRGLAPYEVEYRLRRHDGEYRWFFARAAPVRDDEGRVARWLGTCTDIHEQKKALAQRDEFVSMASHELKTPLASLKIQTQTLKRTLERTGTIEPAKVAAYADRCDQQINRLARLVDDMLDFSRIATGRLAMEKSAVRLDELVRAVLDRFFPWPGRPGQPVSVDVEPGVTAVCDAFRIEQVVMNLVSNALKYGLGRPVEVKLTRRGQTAVLAVLDHGMGIAPEDQQRIFGQFERAGAPTSATGLGLGLFIAERIVRAHGGRIEVDSAPGQGSVFSVHLPLRAEDSDDELGTATRTQPDDDPPRGG